MQIELQLYGKPGLKIDGHSVEISLKKSEALLYYIAYEKRVTRDEVVGVIWNEVEQQMAKKNLRNSLYRLKKDLGIELFACPSKHVIEFDETLPITVDAFGDEQQFLTCYKGRFLEAFSLKESTTFERWRSDVESALNQKYLKLATAKTKLLMDEANFEEALKYAVIMRRIDEFDEATVRLLMTLYAKLNQYKNITEVYSSLKTLLDDEMGIPPDKSTRDLYYNLIYTPEETAQETVTTFGRKKEIEIIERLLHHTAIGQNRQSLILMGEAGVGKTKLLEDSLQKYDGAFKLLKMSCYPAESGYAYKSWNDVFAKIADILEEDHIDIPLTMKRVLVRFFPGFGDWNGHVFTENAESINSDYLEKISAKLFDRLLKKHRLIICIDDLQWMDTASLRLLLSLMSHVEGLVFMATLRNENTALMDDFIAQLYRYDRVMVLPVERFDEEESYAFMDFLSGEPMPEALKQRLYKESEGNAFFIVEGTVALKQSEREPRLKGILDSRFIGVTPNEMKLLVMLSMFFDEVDFELLHQLYPVDEDELLEMIQALKRRFLIKEVESDDSVRLRFTHQKLREHVYAQTPVAKKRILHNRIGGVLEEALNHDGKDIILYQKLIYHYQSAGNTVKYLTYYLKYLKATFDFSHELYPELVGQTPLPMEKTPEELFSELDILLDKLPEEGAEALMIQYLHMKARYLIRQGKYESGMTLIKELITRCKRGDDEEMLFKAYVQWFYYLIQTEQIAKMPEVMGLMARLTKTPKNEAVEQRLMGINSLMAGRYEEARIYFAQSIQSFENLGKGGRYVLGIAASYNYISESYRRQGRLVEALEDVERAIALCRLHNIMRGSSIFNTNAGIIAFELSEDDMAKAYFEEALKSYETVDTLWRRSEAEAYLGVILRRKGQTALGDAYLAKAREHAVLIGTPETMSVIETLEKSH